MDDPQEPDRADPQASGPIDTFSGERALCLTAEPERGDFGVGEQSNLSADRRSDRKADSTKLGEGELVQVRIPAGPTSIEHTNTRPAATEPTRTEAVADLSLRRESDGSSTARFGVFGGC